MKKLELVLYLYKDIVIKMLILIFVFITIGSESFALDCYQCVSKDKESCQKNQRHFKCDETKEDWSGDIIEHSCYTLFYNTVKDNRVTTRYVKGCRAAAKQECEEYCSTSSISRDVDECKVSCCTTDGCNKSSFIEKKESVIIEKRKRSSQNDNTSSANKQNFGGGTKIVFLLSNFALYLTHFISST